MPSYDRFMSGIEKRRLRVRRARLLSPLKCRVQVVIEHFRIAISFTDAADGLTAATRHASPEQGSDRLRCTI
jgi:hypothetical protein